MNVLDKNTHGTKNESIKKLGKKKHLLPDLLNYIKLKLRKQLDRLFIKTSI